MTPSANKSTLFSRRSSHAPVSTRSESNLQSDTRDVTRHVTAFPTESEEGSAGNLESQLEEARRRLVSLNVHECEDLL